MSEGTAIITAEEWDKIAHKRRWVAFWRHKDTAAMCEVDVPLFRDIQRNALEAAAAMCCDWCDQGLPRADIETNKGPLYIHMPDDVQVPCFADNVWRYLDENPAPAGKPELKP